VSVIDQHGRLFGRINLVDAAVGIVILLLIPLTYGTYLLFRPATPLIESVTSSIISKEEERISVGGRLIAKFKVKGTGFTPLLRARIGDADALGFVFENPNSADVLVGPVPVGAHDLVLLDGIQEVARAKGVITIQPSLASTSIRAAGWITNLDEAPAKALTVGMGWPEGAAAYHIVALGPVVPGFRRMTLAGSTIEVPAPGTHAQAAIITLECDGTLAQNPCTLSDRPENRSGPVTISLPGPARPFSFEIEEVLPSAAPEKATLRVRLSPGASVPVRAGDRDALLDDRAAVVTGVSGDVVTLDAGIDRTHEGWRYRGQRLLPGAPFVFATDRYEARSVLQSLDLKTAKP
jgi:hypothetical protein